MQFWIFFTAGTGGDGLANLLEQASNVVAIDGKKYWRIHRIVDNQVKFYAPIIDQRGCFRWQTSEKFSLENNRFNPGYLSAVMQKQNCVVTSHDVTLRCFEISDCQNILQNDIKKILVTCTDSNRMHTLATTKNLQPKTMIPISEPDLRLFDHVVDIDLAQQNWSYMQDFCDQIGLRMQQDIYLQYQDILSGSMTYLDKNFDIEIYESSNHNGVFSYRLVQIWQPTRGNS